VNLPVFLAETRAVSSYKRCIRCTRSMNTIRTARFGVKLRIRRIPEFGEKNVTREHFWRETKNGMGTDLEWGRRRATRVKGAAAEVEGYLLHEGNFSSVVWRAGMESSLERVEQGGKKRDMWRTPALTHRVARASRHR
jgi:hypothetical protein